MPWLSTRQSSKPRRARVQARGPHAKPAAKDKVPAVIYGDGKPPETIALDYIELWKQVLKGHFTSTVFEIDVEGKKNRVIPRDLQVDPVKDQPIHVDFLRIGKDGRIRVAVPVRFVNEALSPGLKRGGVLNIVRHDIEVTCPYDKIPAFFEVDLTGLEIGRSIHISAITLPEGVQPTIKRPRLYGRHHRRRREAGRGRGRGAAARHAGGRCGRGTGGRRRGARPAAQRRAAAAAKGAAPAAKGAAAPAAKGGGEKKK